MKFNTVPQKDFEPWSRMFSGDALFTDAVQDLLKHVDAECSRLMVPPVRIYSRLISLFAFRALLTTTQRPTQPSLGRKWPRTLDRLDKWNNLPILSQA